MNKLNTWIAQIFAPSNVNAQQGVAQKLLESAGLRAGHSTHEAQELRDAAFAFLSVIR